jgi:hypothetical protein
MVVRVDRCDAMREADRGAPTSDVSHSRGGPSTLRAAPREPGFADGARRLS